MVKKCKCKKIPENYKPGYEVFKKLKLNDNEIIIGLEQSNNITATNPALPETSAISESEPSKNSFEELSDEEVLRCYHKSKELEKQVIEKSEAS